MSTTAENLVRNFFHALEARDLDAVVQACTEDVFYQNVPLPPMHGRDAMRAFLAPNLTRMDAFEGRMLAIATAADGSTVLTERVDVFVFGTKRIEVPVMGTLEVRHGLISAWRDYSDIASFVRNMRDAGFEPGPGVGDVYS